MALTGLALILRTALWSWRVAHGLNDDFTKDEAGYLELAQSLTSAYLHPRGRLADLSLLRPPGYPAFLGTLLAPGWGVSTALLMQLLIGCTLVPLTYLLARHLGAQRSSSLVAAGLIAIEPMNLGFAVRPVSETASALLLTGGLILWISSLTPIRCRRLLLAGAVLGLATLVRPMTLYFAPFAFFATVFALPAPRRSWFVAGAALTAGTLLLPSLWMVRNWAEFGVPMMSTIEGTNMLEYRGAAIVAERDRVSLEEGRRRVLEEFRRSTHLATDNAHRSRQEMAFGFSLVRQHPGTFAYTAAKGAQRFVISPGYPYLIETLGGDGFHPRSPVEQAIVVYSWTYLSAVYTAVAIGLVRLVRSGRRWLWLPTLTLLGYVLVVTAGGDTVSRFRSPLMPMIAAIAAIGVNVLVDRRRHPPQQAEHLPPPNL